MGARGHGRPDGFMNFETGMIKTFLEELHQYGIELTPMPSDPEQLLIDRVKFMEWVIPLPEGHSHLHPG
jgi:hypothetical protein